MDKTVDTNVRVVRGFILLFLVSWWVGIPLSIATGSWLMVIISVVGIIGSALLAVFFGSR